VELPLVVGVDGSESSLRAVDWAVREAARHGVPLRLVYASLWERYEGTMPPFSPGRPSEQVMAEHIIASAAERARLGNPDVKLSTDVLPEDTESALLREGTARDALLDAAITADLLVVGARRRRGSFGMHLGPVNHAVLHHSACPVAIVPQAS
jgi:nucleotide-binding universal stress UspA family protein